MVASNQATALNKSKQLNPKPYLELGIHALDMHYDQW